LSAPTKEPAMSTRLETIVTRQKKTFLRDVVFAGFVALAVVVSVASIGTALQVTTQIAQR
jgi:hypothetical protein